MIAPETAGMLRLIGLLGFGISVCLLAFAQRPVLGKMLVFLSACAALLFALLYFRGVMAAADSAACRFLPRFP